MDFEFSDEQLALRDLARDLFQRESPPSRLRSLWGEETPRDDKVWRTMAEAGPRRVFRGEASTDPPTRMAGRGAARDEAFLRGAAATAAVLNGLGMRMLEMTIEHVKSRKQFDRPVGSFQAVKHKLAETHVM